jgi:hypothetical protein
MGVQFAPFLESKREIPVYFSNPEFTLLNTPTQASTGGSTMVSKMFRIVPMVVIAAFALSSAAWATCSNASVSGVYGFVGGGTDGSGALTASLFQLTFDSSTGTFTGTGTVSSDGVIETGSATGTYTIASSCTATGTITFSTGKTKSFAFVVTSTGGVKEVDTDTGAVNEGIAVAQGSPTCTTAGVKGSFGLAATGVFVTGAPFTGPVDLIGELALSDGAITGHVAGSEDGAILSFSQEPVRGSYAINSDCTGTASIMPKGQSTLNFNLVIVDGGKEMLAIETDADTVLSATIQH